MAFVPADLVECPSCRGAVEPSGRMRTGYYPGCGAVTRLRSSPAKSGRPEWGAIAKRSARHGYRRPITPLTTRLGAKANSAPVQY